MSDYVQDPNDSKKTVAGPKPDNAYDRLNSNPNTSSIFKTPNAVIITQTPSKPIGFFFGSSASFAALSDKNLAANYISFGAPTAGTVLNIHPIAYSASLADHNEGTSTYKIALVYKGGLGTGPV